MTFFVRIKHGQLHYIGFKRACHEVFCVCNPAFGRTRQFRLVRFLLLLLLPGIVTPGNSEQELDVQSGETA